ncbi:HAMP domain-containing histidine kinase [Pseudoalteromonas luteoviolacea]|uniref:sensor histidine kinase n=1 Tax=Pseudoalteromonas luteoviolacea TaxID=43657 RepID=UPI001B386B91|nr:HAMP domain-containing sensor histidine kinase [Pseudoalteromonas luteoviolacea]MBQ4812470.1 HAMP domain-containing histidine kinase [Pseudoalteromonas luteoviolacea]
MIRRYLGNTRSMTGRLALFFAAVSAVIGLFCFALITLTLHWAEDRMGERRILIDKKEAIHYFHSNPDISVIQLDLLTTAYNDISLVPKTYRPYLVGKSHFLDEVHIEDGSQMVYLSTFTHNGDEKPIILLTYVDEVELSYDEFITVIAINLTFVVVLVFIFAKLLMKLSQRLIEPVNALKTQLDKNDPSAAFALPNDAANEFQTLAAGLNGYRTRVNELIKREQSFARYASHELRTPLTVIKGASKLLLRACEDGFISRQVIRVQEATTQMSTMTDALLALVRYEREKHNAPFRLVSAEELNSIMAANLTLAQEKQLELMCTIESMPNVQASPPVIAIVLNNLIRNAIAATEEGSIEVCMTASKLKVIDSGCGYDGNQDPQGHGLGLLIVEDFCQRFDWEFSLYNNDQRGCTVCVDFGSRKVLD